MCGIGRSVGLKDSSDVGVLSYELLLVSGVRGFCSSVAEPSERLNFLTPNADPGRDAIDRDVGDTGLLVGVELPLAKAVNVVTDGELEFPAGRPLISNLPSEIERRPWWRA